MKLAPLADMWTQYPTDSKSAVATLVGGTCGDNITKYDWDTCCIRLSHALNYSARPVEGFSGIANPGLGPTAKVRASKGGDNKWYIYSCYDMRAYLEVRFGLLKTFHHAFKDVDLSGLKGASSSLECGTAISGMDRRSVTTPILRIGRKLFPKSAFGKRLKHLLSNVFK